MSRRKIEEEIHLMFSLDKKKEEYIKIATNLSKDSKQKPQKPRSWELKAEQEKTFSRALKRLKKVSGESRFRILHKFFNEIRGRGGGYHKKYMKAIDRINWRIDLIIEDNKEYEAMMEAEIARIIEKD